jgi:hypothetical protein
MELRVVAAITASKKTGVLFCWVCIFDFVVVAAAQTRFLFFFQFFVIGDYTISIRRPQMDYWACQSNWIEGAYIDWPLHNRNVLSIVYAVIF